MKKWFSRIMKVLLPVVVLAATVWFCMFLIATSPKTERKAEPRLPPLVAVARLEATRVLRVVEAFGTVVPAREVTVSSEVQGRVVELHPALEPGGVLRAGETLLKIDPEEYKLAVSRAEAALAEAEAALQVEAGRQRVAAREWELFGKDMPEADLGRDLMLREPQLNQAKAKIDSAKSEVAQARLNLKRTEILVPFDALVLEENVEIGQRVGTNTAIATLAGTETFWIRASVPSAHLGALLESASATSAVKIYSDMRRTGEPTAEGRLLRHLGQVDPEGRMAQVLIQVDDPLHLAGSEAGHLPLPLNSYVKVELDAGALENVLKVPAEGIRENDHVWLIDEAGTLQLHPVTVVWKEESFVAVLDELGPAPQVVVSALDSALPGMAVRLREGNLPAAPTPPPGPASES